MSQTVAQLHQSQRSRKKSVLIWTVSLSVPLFALVSLCKRKHIESEKRDDADEQCILTIVRWQADNDYKNTNLDINLGPYLFVATKHIRFNFLKFIYRRYGRDKSAPTAPAGAVGALYRAHADLSARPYYPCNFLICIISLLRLHAGVDRRLPRPVCQ